MKRWTWGASWVWKLWARFATIFYVKPNAKTVEYRHEARLRKNGSIAAILRGFKREIGHLVVIVVLKLETSIGILHFGHGFVGLTLIF